MFAGSRLVVLVSGARFGYERCRVRRFPCLVLARAAFCSPARPLGSLGLNPYLVVDLAVT
jgi:hypothetical protein